MAIESTVSIYGSGCDINFNVPYLVNYNQGEVLRQFCYDLINREFLGQKITEHTAHAMRMSINRYVPLVYLLIQLDVYHGH